jgi:Peptidase family C25
MIRASLYVILILTATLTPRLATTRGRQGPEAPPRAVAAATNNNISTRLTLNPGKLTPGAPRALAGFSLRQEPAQPALPQRTLRVALHPRADLSTLSIQIESGPTDTLPGRHTLAPTPPHSVLIPGQPPRLSWGTEPKTVLAGRDLDAFSARIFPAQPVVRGRIGNRRGLKVLHLRYTPLRYRHSGQELLLERHTEVTVRYRLVANAAPFPHDPQLPPYLGRLENKRQAFNWYGGNGPLLDTTSTPGYAIIIPDVLSKASKQLAAFAKHKKMRGFEVVTVGDTELAAITIGAKDGDPERIRGWLQKNYKTLNLKYVLLIGNPDPRRAGVPMKLVHTMENYSYHPMITPTDHYYAELTSNWDKDGDGKIAEYGDDGGVGGLDFEPEVYVGRIPVYDNNTAVLDRILAKTMAYENDSGDKSWRGRVLQPAAMLFYDNQYGQKHTRIDGATMADAIFDQKLKALGFTRTTLFEEAGVDPSKLKGDLALTTENVIAEWRKGYGLVTWFGHGSPGGVFRTVWAKDNGDKIPSYQEVLSPSFLTYDDVVQLDDSRPAFVYHGSCSNGSPEQADNIGYGLLRSGAIGTISSTRVAIMALYTGSVDKSSANIFGAERDFAGHIALGKTAGEAHFQSKQEIADVGKLTWFTRMELSLYGDPSVSLGACAKDTDCDDGKQCNGKETCVASQCVAGKAVACAGGSDPCTERSCDEASGKCLASARPEGEACDDGTFCTINETCQQGACKGEPRCAARYNPCVKASCDEQARTCDVFPEDLEGEVCHAGTDREGVCAAGICEPDNSSGCALGRQGGGQGHAALVLLSLLALALLWQRRRRTHP